MKPLLITLLLAILPLTLFAQDDQKNYSEAFTIIEVWLDAQRDFDMLPGISASATEGQELIWSGAFGYANVENEIETTPATLGSVCSISKLFTSVAVMKLYDEGKLRLDDRIEDLLPWYNLEQRYNGSRPITVRTLLTHTAGLPREADFPYWTGPDYPFPSTEMIIEKLDNQQTLYPASTYFQYSNLGMTLLGEIVAEVSGVAYDEYVQKNILDVLELNDTRTHLPEALYGNELATGYGVLLRDGTRNKVNLFQARGVMAAAGFSSNVIDLGAFTSWQLRLLDSDTSEILKPSTLRYMQNVHFTDPGWETTWGLGFVVSKGPDGSKWVSHGGYCPGYQSLWTLNPKSERAYSVIINSNGVNPGKYSTGIHEILAKVTPKSATSEAVSDSLNLSDFTGYYQLNDSESYLSSWEGKLVSIGLPNGNPADNMTMFRHLEGDTFVRIRQDDTDGETIEFERNENGDVIRYKRHQIYITKTIK